jgi:Protein of unknown function (DUF3313)
MKVKNTALYIVAGSIAIFINGCISQPSPAKPAEKQVVIPKEYAKLMKSPHRIPFQKAWARPELVRKYDKIMIKTEVSPVQLEGGIVGNQNLRKYMGEHKKDIVELANYTADSFKKSFAKSRELKIVNKPGPKTMSLKFAIVQVVPNKAVVGAISSTWGLVPGIGWLFTPIKVKLKGDIDDLGGVIAMETIIIDSETGEILVVVADRVKGKMAFFNAKNYTAYGGARQIIDIWTKNIVEALDQNKEGKLVNIKKEDTYVPLNF